jgi:iron complex outermembrane recepter protein
MMVWRSRYCTAHQQDNCTNVNRASALIAAGLSLAFVPFLGAHAQVPTPAAASQGPGLEEIVVTARRRSELLQDVPQTVTPVTAADIQNLNMQDLKDIAQLVPGLQIVPNGNRSLDSNTFRGVSFQPASGTQNTLGFYLNDTFVTNNFVTTSIFDVGQIELLSGPQGTLRGEPSPSGSLTITTHRPDLENFGGYATVTGANHNNWNENAAVNLPIIQGKLALRVAGIAESNKLDGVTSLNNSQQPFSDTYGGRVSLRFEPIDSIETNLMYQKVYFNQAQYPQVEGPGGSGGFLAPGVPNPNAPRNYNGPAIVPSQLLGVQTYPTATWNHQDILTGQLDWHFAGQRLSYAGSYWTWALNGGDIGLAANQAPGITAANPIPREASQFDTPNVTQHTQTQELRLSSETPIFGFMDYTAGGFFRFTKNDVNQVQLASFFPGSFGAYLPPSSPNPFFYDPKYTLQLLVKSPAAEKEYSEFANFTFHLPKDTELTVGGRHISYKKSGSTEADLLPNGVFLALPASTLGLPPGVPCSAAGFGSTYPNTCDLPAIAALRGNTTALPKTLQNLNDNTWIYNVSLSHKLNENLLTYVNVGSSWRPPGVSVGINNANNDPNLTALLHLKPETSTDFEGGFKWTFLENRARFNVAVFHQKFENLIFSGLPVTYLSATVPGPGAPSQFSFNTNPDAVLNGVNLDAGFRPTRQWSFDLNASYTNGHLTGSEIPCNPPATGFPPGTSVFLCPSNASISVAPNFNSSLYSEYHMPMPGLNNVDAFVRGLFNYYGRNPHVSQFYTAPAYGILSLFLGLRSQDNAWEGAFFAKNALNNQAVLLQHGPGSPAIDAAANPTLGQEFGSSGYYGTLVTPRPEIGVTVTYKFGSR